MKTRKQISEAVPQNRHQNSFPEVLEGYFLDHLFLITLGIVVLCVSIVLMIQSLRFLEIAMGIPKAWQLLFKMIGLFLPDALVLILPLAAFVGVLYVYDRLQSDRELIAMRAAGMGAFDLAKPGIIFGASCLLILYTLTLAVVPYSASQVRSLELKIKTSFPTALVQPGVFQTFQGITLYVRSKSREGHLHGIFAYIKRDNEAHPYTLVAQEGYIQEGPWGPTLHLAQGGRQDIDPATKRLSTLHFKQTSFLLQDPQQQGGQYARKPYELYLGELLFPEEGISDQEKEVFAAEAHRRILLPLLAFCLILIPIVMTLTVSYTRRRKKRYVLSATTWGISTYAVTLVLLNAGAQNILFAYGAYLLCCSQIILAFYLLRRADQERDA